MPKKSPGKTGKAPQFVDDIHGPDALEATQRAIAALPKDISAIKFTPIETTATVNFGARNDKPPPNHGKRETPQRHPDALLGLTFVLSGVQESFYRKEIEDMIKAHGGRVTTSVSGKTTFLVVGTDTGESKLLTAKEKKVRLIDEDGLVALIAASSHLKPKAQGTSTRPFFLFRQTEDSHMTIA